MGFNEWQLLVLLTILLAWFINFKFGIVASVFWALWTLGLSSIVLDTKPLYGNVRNLQLINIVISSLIGYYLISNLRSLVSSKPIIRSDDGNKIISSTEDHRNYLIDSIKIAKEEIIISSGFISSHAVDGEFMTVMKKAIDRGVNVFLIYGHLNSMNNKMNASLQLEGSKNLKQLREYSKRYSDKGSVAIGFFDIGDEYEDENGIHEKILIRDNAALVIGSFNWLSNKKGKKGEISIELLDKETIDKMSKSFKTKIIKLSK